MINKSTLKGSTRKAHNYLYSSLSNRVQATPMEEAWDASRVAWDAQVHPMSSFTELLFTKTCPSITLLTQVALEKQPCQMTSDIKDRERVVQVVLQLCNSTWKDSFPCHWVFLKLFNKSLEMPSSSSSSTSTSTSLIKSSPFSVTSNKRRTLSLSSSSSTSTAVSPTSTSSGISLPFDSDEASQSSMRSSSSTNTSTGNSWWSFLTPSKRFLVCKYQEYKRAKKESNKRKITEKELSNLNHKIVSHFLDASCIRYMLSVHVFVTDWHGVQTDKITNYICNLVVILHDRMISAQTSTFLWKIAVMYRCLKKES